MPSIRRAGLALGAALLAAGGTGAADPGPWPLLSDADAWKRLPAATAGAGQPLPGWARVLAGPLPRTVAGLLPLDHAQRTAGPVPPRLRAASRLVTAVANRSPGGEAVAVADARRAGLTADELAAVRANDFARWPDADRAALKFAQTMATDPGGVSDAEFAALVTGHGDRVAAALVLHAAYSNFQDRLLAALGPAAAAVEPPPPLPVTFAPDVLPKSTTPPATPPRPPLPPADGTGRITDADQWAGVSYAQWQEKIEAQKVRPTRLPVPAAEAVAATLPAGYATALGVVWNRVVLGYAPELAMPWETVLRGTEPGRKLDRLFSIALFWVTTRAADCPYCMGHCEMNWEVAGLSKAEIAERSKRLAGADWSGFDPRERRAFAFARTLTAAPADVTPAIRATLVADFGPEAAAAVAFLAARNNYMVRISNGFQLTLERDNVFYGYYNLMPPKGAK